MATLLVLIGLVQAPSATAVNGQPWDNMKPDTWNQGTEPYRPISLGLNSNGLTMYQHGCTQFSMTNILIKVGAKDFGYTPMDFNADQKALLTAGKVAAINSGGLATSQNLHLQASGKMTYDKRIELGGSDGTATVKAAWGANKMILLGVQGTKGMNGHWVMVDSVTPDGKIRIIDSAKKYSFLHEYAGSKVGSVITFNLPAGVTADSLPKLAEGSGSATPGEVVPEDGSDSAGVKKDYLLTEDEILGMPNQRDYTTDQQVPDMPDALDGDIAKQVAELQETIDARDTSSEVDFLRTSVALLGLISLLYGVLILLSWAFDKMNVLFEVSFIRVMTFGRNELLPDGMDPKERPENGKYITGSGVFVRVIIAVALGAILVSGGAYTLVYNTMNWFGDMNG